MQGVLRQGFKLSAAFASDVDGVMGGGFRWWLSVSGALSVGQLVSAEAMLMSSAEVSRGLCDTWFGIGGDLLWGTVCEHEAREGLAV